MVDENVNAAEVPSEQVMRRAKETERLAKDGSFVRLVDHFKREWQIYVMLLPTIIWSQSALAMSTSNPARLP